jgi:hypothetical protein
VSYSNSSTNSSRATNRSKELEYSNNNKFHKFKYLQSEYEFEQEDDYIDLLLEDETNIDSKIMRILVKCSNQIGSLNPH